MQNQSLLSKFYEDSSVVPTANQPGMDTTTLFASLAVVLVAVLALVGAIRRYFDALTMAVTQAAVLLRLGVNHFQAGGQIAPSAAPAAAPVVMVELCTPINASDDTRQFIRQTHLNNWSQETRI